MNRATRIALTAAASLVLTLPAFAQTTRSAGADEPEEVRLSVGRPDEYDGVIADLKIEGEQLARFREKDAERLEKLKAFVESDQGKELIALREQLAAARRAKKPAAEVAALRQQIQPLSDQYWAIRNGGRVELLSILTPAQLNRYVGYTLLARVSRGLERVKLTPEQQAQARAIADDEAGKWISDDVVKTDPYFRGLMSVQQVALDRIRAEVLTDEQRQALRPATRRAAE